ncbi:hypothetical protein ACH5RR_020502 [Cinchona calisaya]|uniref:Uncharacterized protein n=1 Tax=Cinchona calisaya TaxID=153742 RepID=A0ABD2ZFS9_9GENT
MDDLDVLAREFGFRPQGKSNPMRSDGGDRRSSSARSSYSAAFHDDHSNRDGLSFNDVFGGPPRYSNTSNNANNSTMSSSSSTYDFDYESIFKSSASNNISNNHQKTSSAPVYDKPVYDEDIFNGLPGVKNKSASSMGEFDGDVFESMASPPRRNHNNSSNDNENYQFDDLPGKSWKNERNNSEGLSSTGFEDLLGSLTGNEPGQEGKNTSRSSSSRGVDDLLGGFVSDNPAKSMRPLSESSHPPKSTSSFNQSSSHTMDIPFVVLESTSPPASSPPEVFTDTLKEIGKLGKSGSRKTDSSSVIGGVFDDLDPLNGFGKSTAPFSPEKSNREKDRSPLRSGSSMSNTQTSDASEHVGRSSFRQSGSHSQRAAPDESFQESPLFDIPTVSENSQKSYSQNASSPPHMSVNIKDANSQAGSEEQVQPPDDVWLTVSEIPLFTQPTRAPPPARPPPPIPRRTLKSETGLFSSNARKKNDDFSSPPSYSSYSQSPKAAQPAGKGTFSQIDELEDFAMGRTQNSTDEAYVHLGEEMNASSVAAASAAAMKEAQEAMDRAEAKFRHAKEVREREYSKVARSRENMQMEKDEQATQEAREKEFRENQEKLENERRRRQEEREQRRRERERERAREIERERNRQAVERATREARERAAIEARLKAERAAVEKAQGEARGRAERAAVQRAQAEARERAAAEAKERAEKTAAEARERANAETREKEARDKEAQDRAAAEKAAAEARRRAERAAVERAAAEARERAAVEAREKAAYASRVNQQRSDNDLESFFSSRPSSAPRPRANSSDTMFDTHFQSTGVSQGVKPASFGGNSSNMRKASSATNIVDDLSSIFGAAPSSGEFQEVEGETEERRRARLERHQRTQERAAKAVAEKNQRDVQAQKEQEERYRIAETLDIEIKRWAAGKEGNLRALLSTLQYVLWPECGWQPVSLTDLITGANVKKVYRKATLCIHPDKVQQKGATLQQKYIAEKVFDLLKEAWNKFNSEELF